jgi:hypothetical protein
MSAPFLVHKKINPAYAVCCKVLDLLVAGWAPTQKRRLGSGLSRYSCKIRAHLGGVGPKRGSNITNTAGYDSYTIKQEA